MGLFDPNSPTAPVEAAVALLAHLEDAASCMTYLDLPFSETVPIFEAIERCREHAADLLGVEVEVYVQRKNESREDYERRMDEWSGGDR
jgi:hypothetical protein